MRLDKLTTAFQQALADAQSLAIGQDNPSIEPLHLLITLLDQAEGASKSLLARAGGNVQKLYTEARQGLERLAKVSQANGQVTLGSELNRLLNLTDREAQRRGDQFLASELFLLVLSDDKGEAGRLLREAGV